MNLNFPKDWCIKAAKNEGDHEVGAMSPEIYEASKNKPENCMNQNPKSGKECPKCDGKPHDESCSATCSNCKGIGWIPAPGDALSNKEAEILLEAEEAIEFFDMDSKQWFPWEGEIRLTKFRLAPAKEQPVTKTIKELHEKVCAATPNRCLPVGMGKRSKDAAQTHKGLFDMSQKHEEEDALPGNSRLRLQLTQLREENKALRQASETIQKANVVLYYTSQEEIDSLKKRLAASEELGRQLKAVIKDLLKLVPHDKLEGILVSLEACQQQGKES